MKLRFEVLRNLCWLLWFLSWLAATLAALAAVESFRMPGSDLTQVYRWSVVANRVGMAALLSSIAVGFMVDWLAQPFTGINKVARETLRRPRKVQRAGRMVIFVLFLSMFFASFRYVHPEGSRWIATGKARPIEVSAAIARIYLWRSVRMDTLFVLAAAWILANFSWSNLVGIRQVEMAGEELIPRVVTHVKPTDFRD